MLTDYYCPKCGEYSSGPVVDMIPGKVEHTCPECGTEWIISIGFTEKEPEGEL